MMSRYFRIFTFMGQVFAMAKANPRLFLPIVINVVVAVPINIFLCIAMYSVESPFMAYALPAVGVISLYYTDYFCNGLAASMIYDQVTTGNATITDALSRTARSSFGILIFATVSGIFDLAAHYASERNDVAGRIIMGILRSIWTAATYVVMPAMVIEGLGFGEAFKRSKWLAENDPTQVGIGVVGMGLASWLISTALGMAAYFVYHTLGGVAGFFMFFTITNVAWALTGYLRITYFTCFYLWARECYTRGAADPRFAPGPLAATLA
jgi:hypothetical protein